MEFALLIWAIGMLPNLVTFLSIILTGTIFYLALYYAFWLIEGSVENPSHRIGAMLTAIFLSILLVIIPSTKTAYMMVGAYAAQKVVEAPETKQITSKIIAIVNEKLDQELQRK